jgi:hypothetical protein
MLVFRVTGAAAMIAHITPALYDSIWKSQKCSISFKFIIDGVIYSLVTAGTFGWLWPDA